MNVNGINNDNTQQYTVNADGAIEVNSIKNKSLFAIADKCDNAENDNDLLEGYELQRFFRAVNQDEKMKELLSIESDFDKYTYYEQKDQNGQLLKKCISTKKNCKTMTFHYKDGKPVYCVSVAPDSEKDLINLNTGKSQNFLPGSTESRPFTLNQKNCEMLKRVALDKPAKTSNGITELFYRLVNWDWDWSWSQHF